MLMSLVIPGKIALPFKKINDAVRELQDCNFDVSIYYNQDDEIGELARELNKMITSMKHFEELREDRISVEHRKFDILASMIKKNILIANASGELIYLNNQMYRLLNIESDTVLNKNMEDTIIPASIKEAYNLALKRRSKIDNAEITISAKTKTEELDEDGETIEVENEEVIFSGFANVIPIRAKESSLDYYLMVLSKEVFA
jgi:signal transduction histidine kinase